MKKEINTSTIPRKIAKFLMFELLCEPNPPAFFRVVKQYFQLFASLEKNSPTGDSFPNLSELIFISVTSFCVFCLSLSPKPQSIRTESLFLFFTCSETQTWICQIDWLQKLISVWKYFQVETTWNWFIDFPRRGTSCQFIAKWRSCWDLFFIQSEAHIWLQPCVFRV